MRALGRVGCSVIASDSNPDSLGLRSRYTSSVLTYPDPQREPERFRDALLDRVRRDRVDLVIPVTDLDIAAGTDYIATIGYAGSTAVGCLTYFDPVCESEISSTLGEASQMLASFNDATSLISPGRSNGGPGMEDACRSDINTTSRGRPEPGGRTRSAS